MSASSSNGRGIEPWNIGWFAEIPGDCVVKVKPDDTLAATLQSNLRNLTKDGSLRKTIGERARKFVITEHNIQRTADDYMAFIRNVIEHRAPESIVSAPSVSWSLPIPPSGVSEAASQLPPAPIARHATTRSNGEGAVSLSVERQSRTRDRLTLAYFSPFAPQRSGIADYSEELLPRLADGADITLFTDGFQPSNGETISQFEICDYQKHPAALSHLDRFDAVVYHMGNDHRYHTGIFDAMRRHSGVVVFHDFALQDFFLGLARTHHDLRIYLDEVGAGHGEVARREAAATLARGGVPAMAAKPLEFPLNQRLARGAEGIIVHSEWSRTRLQGIAPGVPVRVVPHHVTLQAASRAPSTSRPGPGPVRIASFGIITSDKGIERSLSALASLRDKCDFRYAMVGEPSSYFDVQAMVRRYGLEDRVEITGHVTLEEFERRIGETDIVLNLRARTNGETSGSLCRVMAAGVASIVSDMGWFSELPADTVVKVPQDEYSAQLLRAYLEKLIEDPELRGRIGANARRHMLAEHDIEHSAAGYLSFINEIVSARPRRRLLSGLTAELSALGLSPDRDEKLFRTVAAGVAELAPERWFEFSPAKGGVSKTGNGMGRASVASSTSDKSLSNSETEAAQNNDLNGRLRMPGIDYKQAAIEYLGELSEERRHHLRTKPFYNLANKPAKYQGEGMDEDTHRHFCDFANMSIALALPPHSRILDVGCGSGWLSEYFARLGYVVKGIDISPDLIEMSRLRVDRVPYGVDHETPLHCTFEVHDIELAPLKEKFDAIVCYDSLHHFEDERAVMRHLAAMLDVGGMLFILEGERPPAGSPGEEELLAVMREFRTLESPFDSRYLRQLLDENGLAIVGDYVSVNGLFSRESFDGDRLRIEAPKLNYFLCKKVTATLGRPASTVPDSRSPSTPRASLSFAEPLPLEVLPNGLMRSTLLIENTGDTLWLVGPAERAGSVMVGTKVFDDAGVLVMERHGTPALQRALAPGESARLAFEFQAPRTPGHYTLKLDMVAQQVCWFEERGSTPLEIGFFVQ
jgi:2-polyprenyl-3-methyl-5-hydroxy-6-metoxy-1,4-benzoquinol methylase/glycosyltransferase involved in cell wall biosynthesis